MALKQKHIESFLQDMQGFDYNEKEKWSLEQHMTPPNIAAQMLFEIYNREPDLDCSVIGDLGCGTGMLSTGMLYIGSMQVVGFELDQKYIQRTKEQIEERFDEEDGIIFDVINTNVKHLQDNPKHKLLDIVVMNPPFGTKDEGIDLVFLQKARANCSGNIYSLHKTSTRNFLKKTVESWGYEFEVIQKFKFPLPKRFHKYHKKDMAFTEVDFICLIAPEQEYDDDEEEQKEIEINFEELKYTGNIEEEEKRQEKYLESCKQENSDDDEEEEDSDDDEEEEEEDEEEDEEEQNDENEEKQDNQDNQEDKQNNNQQQDDEEEKKEEQ